MLVGQPGKIGDLERVREEVALRVTQVPAVEPHVGLVEDALETNEPAAPLRGCIELEVMAVQQRAVAVGERRVAAPVPGDRHLGPLAVVVVEAHAIAAHVVVGDARAPGSRQLHDVGA